jgi:hypothetical protein
VGCKRRSGVLFQKTTVSISEIYYSNKDPSVRFQSCFQTDRSFCSWDDKWIYLQQKFVSGGTVYAIGFNKIVVKNKRTTISPEEVLKSLGCNISEVKSTYSGDNFGVHLNSLEETFQS